MSILDENPAFRVGLRSTQIVVTALFGGVVLFLGVATFLVTRETAVARTDPLLSYVLPVAGVLGITMASVVRRLILRQAEGLADAAGASEVPVRRFHAWRTTTILMAAAIEGAALLSAVAAIVDGHAWPVVVGGLFACLLLLHVPTERRLERCLGQDPR